jgi:aspartate carbamoyltransferase catalytic subunit
MDGTIMLKFLPFQISQALLDIYTIEREIGKLDGIKVGLVGDLANGRTVRSLAYLLAKYRDVKIYLVSPNVVKMKVIVINTIMIS